MSDDLLDTRVDCAIRIAGALQVPRRAAPQAAAECAMMLGELCNTAEEIEELTDALVRNPPVRRQWDRAAVERAAEAWLNPPPPPPAPQPTDLEGIALAHIARREKLTAAWTDGTPIPDLLAACRYVEHAAAHRLQGFRQKPLAQLRERAAEELAAYLRGATTSGGAPVVITPEMIDARMHALVFDEILYGKRRRRPQPKSKAPPAENSGPADILDKVKNLADTKRL